MGYWGVLSSPIGCNLQNWSNFTLWAARCNKGEREDLLEKGERRCTFWLHIREGYLSIYTQACMKKISSQLLESILYIYMNEGDIKNANLKKNPPNFHTSMHQLCHYSFSCQKMSASQGLDNGIVMEDISRYFSTQKWHNRLSCQILKFWIDLQSLIVYQASYRLNLGKPKSNSHWSMLLHLTCFINLLIIAIWKNYPFYWPQKFLPTVI